MNQSESRMFLEQVMKKKKTLFSDQNFKGKQKYNYKFEN